MQRSAEQRTRRFLATAFKRDGPGTAVRRMSPLNSTSIQLHFLNIEGPFAEECSAIRLSFFDISKQRFFGTTYLAEIGLDDVIFHASTETTQVVFEAIYADRGGVERVACWWYVSLSELASTKAVTLRRGCGDLLLLDRSVWPLPETVPPTVLHIGVTLPSSRFLPSVLPAGYCQDSSFADLDVRAPLPFRVKVSALEIQEVAAAAGTSSPLEKQGTWSCLVMAHNTHRMLSGCQELALRADVVGNLSSTKDVEIPHLPVHKDTCLVVALRFKENGSSKYAPVGYMVFDLVTGVPTLRDCDVNVRNLPVLSGPFSCEDPRCLSLETQSQYTSVGLSANIKVSFYETPISATMVEEYEDGTLVGSEVAAVGSTTQEEATITPSQHQTTQPVVPQSTMANDQLPPPHPSTPQPNGGSDDVPGLSPSVPTVQGLGMTGEGGSNGDIYRMLCDLMSEVRDLRKQRMQAPAEDAIPGIGYADPADAASTPTGFPQNVVSLRPRRNVIPNRRRLLMTERCRPLVHPTTGQRLQATDSVQLPGDLPNTLFMVRVEGLTLRSSSYEMPPQLAMMASYANNPMVRVGPMRTRRLPSDGDDFGISFTTTSTEHTDDTSGAVWCEPIQTAQDSAFTQYKSTGTMYLHFYDAATMFYMGSSNLRLSRFQRPPSSLFASTQLDLPLYEDVSHMERTPEEGVPLIVNADAGYVHLTIAAVGVPSLGAPNPSQELNTGNKGVFIAQRLVEDPINGGAQQPFETPSTGPPRGAAGFGEKRVHLHSERAKYVRHLLHDRTLNTVAQQVNGGKLEVNAGDRAELEFKLRYVERRRDEVKSTKIAETLKRRMTVTHDVTAWMGGPKVIETLFSNPYPISTTFQIDIPPTSKHIALHTDTPSLLLLGPKQDTVIKVVVAVQDHQLLSPSFNTQAIIRTTRMETAKVISLNVRVIEPVIHRRYELCAAPGQTATKRIHLRAFPPAPRVEMLPSMCHYCTVSSDSIVASTGATVESLSASTVAAWEEVVITSKMGQEATRAFVILYRDANQTDPFETWEIISTPCQQFSTSVVPYGQTSVVAIPVPASRVYSADPSVEAVGRQDCTSLRVTPRGAGSMTFLLHSLQGDGTFRKILCTVPCVLPTPTYEDFIDVPLQQAGTPIFRRLQFVNKEPVHKMFKLLTTYRGHLHVTPEQFSLTPTESKQISIRIDNLEAIGGEGRLPMWIFVNDAENRTIDSYLITVSLRSFIPITAA